MRLNRVGAWLARGRTSGALYRCRMVGGDELPSDWWTTENVATALGVSASTIRAYVARNQMPAPDRTMGNMRLWRPETIRKWHASRPRKQDQGSGSD